MHRSNFKNKESPKSKNMGLSRFIFDLYSPKWPTFCEKKPHFTSFIGQNKLT